MIAKGFILAVVVVVDSATNPPSIIRYTIDPNIPPIKGMLIK
jgi:hypothetical protein